MIDEDKDSSASRDSDTEEDDEEEEAGSDPESDSNSESDSDSDKVMCKCGCPNTRHMIGCDGPTCPYQWLHFKCAGVDTKNIPKGKWFCPDCQRKRKGKPHRFMSMMLVKICLIPT